jgi:hypothetical protein
VTGRKTDGRKRFSKICVNGSNSEYDMKKIVRVLLYSLGDRSRSSTRP